MASTVTGTVGRHRREAAFSDADLEEEAALRQPTNDGNAVSPIPPLASPIGQLGPALIIAPPPQKNGKSSYASTSSRKNSVPSDSPVQQTLGQASINRRPSVGSRNRGSVTSVAASTSSDGRNRGNDPHRSISGGAGGGMRPADGSVHGTGSKGISRGIDSELDPVHNSPPLSKRRSMFRSAGTASTPDLKAKDPRLPVSSTSRNNEYASTSSTIRRIESPRELYRGSTEMLASTPSQPSISSSPSVPPPQSAQLPQPASGAQQRYRAASHGAALRENSKTSEDQGSWDRLQTGEQYRGGAASSTALGQTKGTVFPEGHMSVGKRARGMFGRLFSSGNKESGSLVASNQRSNAQPRPTIHATSSRPAPPPPPVPDVPLVYKREKSAVMESPISRQSMDMPSSRQAIARSPPSLPRASEDDARSLPHAILPSSARRESALSVEELVSGSQEPAIPSRRSRHVREAGTHVDADEESHSSLHLTEQTGTEINGLPPSVSDSTPQRNLRKWTQDMEGILDGDGADDDLAMGLGLPASSMRVRTGSASPATLATGDGSPVKRAASVAGLARQLAGRPNVSTRTTSISAMDHMEPDEVVSDAQDDYPGLVDGSSTLTDLGQRSVNSGRATTDPPGVPGVPQGRIESTAAPSLHISPAARFADDMPIGRERTTTTGDSETITSPKTPQGSVFPDTALTSSPACSTKVSHINNDDLDSQGRQMAAEFLSGDESHVAKDRVAEYLGGLKPLSRFALRHYMQDFDFSGLRLDVAFRNFCQKLYLKAETQEIDRILEGFSDRYCACNPNTIFISPTVVHVVTGSFLLLNTDLHIADIQNHMSRNQFTKLTLETIYANVAPPQTSMRSSTPDLVRDDSYSSLRQSMGSPALHTSNSQISATTNVSKAPPGRTISVYSSASGNEIVGLGLPTTGTAIAGLQESKIRLGSNASIASSHVYSKGWEAEIETALREIYNAVRSSQILLPVGAPIPKLPHGSPQSQRHNMNGMSSRPGTNTSSADRLGNYKRGSIRGVGNFLGASPYGDGRTSPTPSYATSIGESYQHQFLAPPSLGFASNLSHTVIREQEDEAASVGSLASDSTVEDMSDDELALLGAPWAKEGNLQRKPYWDGPHKRSKEKQWKGVFVVIQRGDLHMFTFGEGTSSTMSGVGVGGGNWMQNAKDKGEMNLSHSLASALPPPGYNASRPYCFSLTLPNGEMSFFQAGTEDLVQEWVQTCNYWAARRSRPPLPGGVSNLEYGWKSLESSDDTDEQETRSIMSNRSGRSRMSFQHTLGRRAIGGGLGNGSGGGDRLHISDWKAPQASLIPSAMEEEAQMESLQRHIIGLVKELERHKSLEEPLSRLYPPRSTQLLKAKENWKIKFQFIHSEVVKYETYVDCLKTAISLRLKRQGEKKLERSLQRELGRMDEEDDGDMSPELLEAMRVTPVPTGEYD